MRSAAWRNICIASSGGMAIALIRSVAVLIQIDEDAASALTQRGQHDVRQALAEHMLYFFGAPALLINNHEQLSQ